MIHGSGDDYVASVQAKNTRQKLLADFKTNVKRVLGSTVEAGRRLVCHSGDESADLCDSLEAILCHGVRGIFLHIFSSCSVK